MVYGEANVGAMCRSPEAIAATVINPNMLKRSNGGGTALTAWESGVMPIDVSVEAEGYGNEECFTNCEIETMALCIAMRSMCSRACRVMGVASA